MVGNEIMMEQQKPTISSNISNLEIKESRSAEKPKIDISRRTSVDKNCTSSPFVKPRGNIFYDSNAHNVESLDKVKPLFRFGSLIGENYKYHMDIDTPDFHLIKEVYGENKLTGGLSFGIGANQGFCAYYLALLGMNMHAFEIFEPNYKALQHRIFFNPPHIGSRVNVYPI